MAEGELFVPSWQFFPGFLAKKKAQKAKYFFVCAYLGKQSALTSSGSGVTQDGL